MRKVYANDRIEVTWEPERCIHVAECLQRAPTVFDARRRPWVNIDGADPDTIAQTVLACPSGALHFRRLDDGPQEEPEATTRVRASADGPLYVRGRVAVVDELGRVVREDTRVTLCRCGYTRNAPFCDNSHRVVGFTTASGGPFPERADHPDPERGARRAAAETPEDCD